VSTAGRIVIVGAGGDLTTRYLLPALARLEERDLLPDGVDVWGLAHVDQGDEGFRLQAAEALDRHAGDLTAEARARLCRRLRYHCGDATEPDHVRAVAREATGPVVYYLALPPAVFAPALEAIGAAGPADDTRVVVEKPFGQDLADARRLNRLLAEGFGEERVFRIDHFLGLQTAQNLLGIRFGNRLFESSWHAGQIRSVDLVWDETVGLEGRAAYYDHAGAVRDMVQNHLLQLLALTALDRPAALTGDPLRDAKVAALERVRIPGPDDLARDTRRARYGAGRVGDRNLAAYVAEAGVDPARGTETFAEITLHLDDERWAGVPFRLRTGKALARDRREIRLTFEEPDAGLFPVDAGTVNALTMTMDPDAVDLDLAVTAAHDTSQLAPARLRADCGRQDLPTYARLLLDILRGDPTFSIRGDEAEASWRIVEPILAGWEDGRVPLEEYPAGSDGPAG
jgi:glucose-6-phosphate 1-dehydrogenase